MVGVLLLLLLLLLFEAVGWVLLRRGADVVGGVVIKGEYMYLRES